LINICILTYYVHLDGVKEVIDYRNARSGKLQDNRVFGRI